MTMLLPTSLIKEPGLPDSSCTRRPPFPASLFHAHCLKLSLLTFFISNHISHTDHQPWVKVRLGLSPLLLEGDVVLP